MATNKAAHAWQVDVSLDGGRWWQWSCSRVEFMGAGVFELDVYGPAEVVVCSWAYLTHSESLSLAVEPGARLLVHVRDGRSIWCCESVVRSVHRRDGSPASTRVVCDLMQVSDAG